MNRLHTLLRIRKRAETLADGELASATRTRLAAQEAYEELLRADAIVSTGPQPRSLPELLALRMQGIAAQEILTQAADTLEHRKLDEVDARVARTAAAVRRRSVQRVVERRDAEQKLIAQHAARRALAELARLSVAER
ncbi:MAG TPA: hypothetical protein VK891_01470 [Euzebyales bacterium]|nr:hypothetical protein [Euzebyales bacterium]